MSTVLVLEGEGCAQLAAAILPDYTVIAWSHIDEDRAAFTDNDVQLWPLDAKRGLKVAASLVKACRSVAIIDSPDEDFSVVLGSRHSGDAVVDFIKARLKPVAPPAAKSKPNGKHVVRAPSSGLGSAFGVWQSLGLDCNAQGMPYPTIDNAATILEAHAEIKDRIWFDDMSGKIMQSVAGKHSLWTDAEDLQVCRWLQRALKIPKLGLNTAVHAIQSVAFGRRRNPLTAYLNALTWDGTVRKDDWLSDFLGAPKNAYTVAVGCNWLFAMIARAFKPGVKADYMPVLEGLSNAGKSSALEILGGQWYKASPQAFGSKEFFEVIQGAWLIEIPDMVGFGRREHTQIISAITTRSDWYRAPYERHASDHPRTCIFAATSENDDYLKDTRGIRRYWPVRCGEINLEGLESVRDQLFAEAVREYKRGATWWKMPAVETREEQLGRQQGDIWLDSISAFCSDRGEVTVRDVASFCLEIKLERQDQIVSNRISSCLKLIGYSQSKPEWRNGKTTRIYRR